MKVIEHRHIPHKHPDWSAHNYQCVCGFKTGSIQEFDMHLKENDNQNIHPTEKRG